MAASLRYVSLPNLYYLMEGLTFDVPKCAECLDAVLIAFNRQTRKPDKIINWNKSGPTRRGKLAFPNHGRLIAEISEIFSPEKGVLRLAKIMEAKGEKETPPAAVFVTRSLSLDIPMRIEVPLRWKTACKTFQIPG